MPANDGTSSSSPLASGSRPSRTQTPQLPGSNDASSQMHISGLSLDEHAARSPHGRGHEAYATRRLELTSPSKKRPASSEAHDSRHSQARTRLKDDAAHVALTHANMQGVLIDEYRRPKPNSERLYDPQANDFTNHNQRDSRANSPRNSPHQVQHSNRGKGPSDKSEPPHLMYPTMPAGASAPSTDMPPRTEQMIRTLGTSTISEDTLLVECNRIYLNLENAERQCMAVDQALIADPTRQEKWDALTALHRTLLYEHHDFLLASQHPCSTPAVRALAAERQIPFRLWKHGILAYLEILRPRLPATFEFMESFIYMAYQMMGLLYETVPAYQDVWIECLGDLARYRSAMEGQSASSREIWNQDAIWWFATASLRQPLIGRYHHHLGMLARPKLAKQLFFYCKSLCCVRIFPEARRSLRTLFAAPATPQPDRVTVLDHQFVQLHRLIFETRQQTEASRSVRDFIHRLAQVRTDKKWKEQSVFLAICNISACFGYGDAEHPLRMAVEQVATGSSTGEQSGTPGTEARSERWRDVALSNLNCILHTMLQMVKVRDDEYVLPHIHIIMVFLHQLCPLDETYPAARHVLRRMPWKSMVQGLNAIGRKRLNMTDQVRRAAPAEEFFSNENGIVPLMEDSAMRGVVWCKDYFPQTWFDKIDRDELPDNEPPSADRCRAQRILWSAARIASVRRLDCKAERPKLT